MDFSTSLPFSKVLAGHPAIFPTVCVPGRCCPHVRAHPAPLPSLPRSQGLADLAKGLSWPPSLISSASTCPTLSATPVLAVPSLSPCAPLLPLGSGHSPSRPRGEMHKEKSSGICCVLTQRHVSAQVCRSEGSKTHAHSSARPPRAVPG